MALLKDYENPGGSAELIEAIKISASLQRMYVKYAELKNNNIELGDFMWDKGVCVRVRSYRTQSTIYLKLKYGEPSGTVVNVRKSMWVHPAISRALSVREAARLQTFPDSFVFMGTKDSQYQQVGNAVPPILARAIADTVLKYLDSHQDVSVIDRILIEMAIDPEVTQMEIAERAGISQATVNMNTKRMISEGIVEKIQTDQNKKVWIVKQ